MRAAVFLLVAGPALACQVCLPYPKESLADRLLAAGAVVLAREDPDRPFHYAAVEVLKGEPSAPIDLFVDSTTRRLLRGNADRSVLLAEKDGWRRLATVDPDLLAVVRDVLRGVERPAYFAKLLGHPDAAIRDLAHLEVARAPYAFIREVDVPRATVLAGLRDRRYAEWRALHVLLLARTGVEADRKTIVETVRARPARHLAAWATAYVEIGGEGAIADLEDRYFGAPRDELREIVRALSVQGGERFRERVVKSYAALLARRPEMAPDIVGDLLAWRRWELADAVRRARTAVSSKNANRLDWFVAMAARARG